MNQRIEAFLVGFYQHYNPYYLLTFCFLVGILFWLASFSGQPKDDDLGYKIALLYCKNVLVKLLSVLLIAFPFLIILAAYSVGFMPKYGRGLWEETGIFFSSMWYSAILFCTLPLLLSMAHKRYISPKLSRFLRRFRVQQSGESLSDVRTVLDVYKPKNFDPRDYYKDGHFFLGLDQNDEAVYVEDSDFNKAHLRIIGPTQCGKGVGLGVLIDQAIRKQYCVAFLDVKPDDFIYDIMRETCEEIGRDKPIVVDLNGYGIGRYAPFANGTKRDRRERFISAMDLNDDGTNADYYRRNAREVFDFLEPYWDGSIQNMFDLMNGKAQIESIPQAKKDWIYENSGNVRSALAEWKNHKPFNPKQGRGFNLAESIKNNQVMYIRSHAKDKLVRKASTVLVEELTQIGLQRGKGKNQVFFVFDEVRFVISETMADGLATLLSKGINMALAYQSINDLLSLPDQRMNAQSIKAGVETNTRRSIFYTASDNDTAEWVSKYSGTVLKSVARSETVTVNEAGAEEWDNQRVLHKTEEGFIHENVVKNLPERIGVFFQPNSIATMLHTCWIPVKEFVGIPMCETPDKKEEHKKPAISKKKMIKKSKESSNKEEFPNRKKAAENAAVAATVSDIPKDVQSEVNDIAEDMFADILNEGSNEPEPDSPDNNEISDVSKLDGV